MAVSKSQQRAVHKYVKANYDRMELTVPKGRKDTIKAHAAVQGESVNGFINRAIDHEMERDTTGGPSEATGARLGEGAISIPPTTIKAAREAAEAAGEELPVFVTRAVETQAQRDSITRKMKKAPDKKSEA